MSSYFLLQAIQKPFPASLSYVISLPHLGHKLYWSYSSYSPSDQCVKFVSSNSHDSKYTVSYVSSVTKSIKSSITRST